MNTAVDATAIVTTTLGGYMRRQLHILSLLLLALTACAFDGSVYPPVPPIFYLSCDSEYALRHPETGPAGTLSGTPTFVEGRKGKAYQVNATSAKKLSYPGSIVPPDRGTIECWAKLVNPPAVIPWHGSPALFWAAPAVPFTVYQIAFNGNDGGAGGGLVAWTGYSAMSSGPFTQTFSYAEVLGGASQVQAWHHYAVAWDADGIPGTSRHMQFYLDGKPAGKTLHDSDQFPIPVDFYLGWIDDNYGSSAVAIDELKIWNYAKSSFSDGIHPGFSQGFGKSVDICGDRMAVADEGHVRIYQRTGAGWRFQDQIADITGIGINGNTNCVQIAGDILAVGGSHWGPPGGVAMYERTADGTWPLRTVLSDPQVDWASVDSNPWGNAIDLDHGILVVGGANWATGASSGSVTVFERVLGPSGSTWQLRDHLANPLPVTSGGIETFGSAVAVSGQTIAVSGGGQVWLYGQDADAGWHWRREGVSLPVRATGLALDGDTLAAGDHATDTLRLYRRRNPGWALEGTITAPVLGYHWSWSFALEGGLLAVRGTTAGVSIYERAAGAWPLRQALSLTQGEVAWHQGFTQLLAVDGGTLIAGEPNRSGLTGPGIGRVAVITAKGAGFEVSAEIAPPAPLLMAKLGTVPAVVSSVVMGNDVDRVVVTSSGATILGTADQCGYVPFTLSGDGEIVARIISQKPATTGYTLSPTAKAGLMIRESLEPGARNIVMALMPSGLMFQWREFANGVTTLRPKGAAAAPIWLKIARKGTSVAGYASPDGVTWTMQGVRPFIAGPVHIGLVVNNTATQAATVVFDGVRITPPPMPGAPDAATAGPNAPSASGLLLVPLLKR